MSGCASTPTDQPPSLISETQPPPQPSAETYTLSDKELKYDCKKLTGIMQVRILQVRDYDPKNNASLAARSVQSVTTPILGGTTVGLDPAGQYRRDLAMLEAYNRQLAAKRCKTFDLAAELKGASAVPTATRTTP